MKKRLKDIIELMSKPIELTNLEKWKLHYLYPCGDSNEILKDSSKTNIILQRDKDITIKLWEKEEILPKSQILIQNRYGEEKYFILNNNPKISSDDFNELTQGFRNYFLTNWKKMYEYSVMYDESNISKAIAHGLPFLLNPYTLAVLPLLLLWKKEIGKSFDYSRLKKMPEEISTFKFGIEAHNSILKEMNIIDEVLLEKIIDENGFYYSSKKIKLKNTLKKNMDNYYKAYLLKYDFIIYLRKGNLLKYYGNFTANLENLKNNIKGFNKYINNEILMEGAGISSKEDKVIFNVLQEYYDKFLESYEKLESDFKYNLPDLCILIKTLHQNKKDLNLYQKIIDPVENNS